MIPMVPLANEHEPLSRICRTVEEIQGRVWKFGHPARWTRCFLMMRPRFEPLIALHHGLD